MIRRLLAAATLALAAVAAPSAQTDPSDAPVRTFDVRDGEVYLDGRHLPNAAPAELDLSGFSMEDALEFSGPISPVLEIDGVAYVLEGERLVSMEASSRPDRGVYILADVTPDALPEERVMPIVEAAYMRDVAARDQALYTLIQQEQAMEAEVDSLAARVRTLPFGPERSERRTQLRGLLSNLLTLKHEIRAEEIRVAAERLESAREALGTRLSHHDDIVNGRLRELVGDQ